MTKKPLNPLEDPPTASSSEEDEVESSAGEEDEEEVSSSEEEEAPIKSAVTIASSTKPASDSESGSETETDSDSETKETQPKSAALALPAVKSGKKRPSEETTPKEREIKRAKKVERGGEDTKKPAFQRLWSEEDEIAVLQGMIDFKNETGRSPYDDTNVYYDFIKKSISFEVSKNQFMDKIRSLKKKYMGKEKNGSEKSFSKAHDKKSLALSKFIWGPEGMGLESAVKSNGVSKKKPKKVDSVKQELFASPNGKEVVVEEAKVSDVEPRRMSDWFEGSFVVQSLAGFGVGEEYVKQIWKSMGEGNKKKIEDELKDLQPKEMDFVVHKTEFLHELATMIADASKN